MNVDVFLNQGIGDHAELASDIAAMVQRVKSHGQGVMVIICNPTDNMFYVLGDDGKPGTPAELDAASHRVSAWFLLKRAEAKRLIKEWRKKS